MKKTKLERRQEEMRTRHDRRAKRGRPPQTEVVDDLGIVRQHLVAWKLLQLGHSTAIVAATINKLFDRDITVDAVARWIECGCPLLNQRLTSNRGS